jgi:hypothetical protein
MRIAAAAWRCRAGERFVAADTVAPDDTLDAATVSEDVERGAGQAAAVQLMQHAMSDGVGAGRTAYAHDEPTRVADVVGAHGVVADILGVGIDNVGIGAAASGEGERD